MATTVTINYNSLNKRVGQSKNVKRKLARYEIHPRVKKAQREMLDEFDDHKVTRELEGGAYASNISNTLQGVENGNLFSFLGFYDGDDPIGSLREKLDRNISIRKITHVNGTRYKITLQGLPDKKAIYSSTPLPWASGRSWVDGIEHGVAGFGQYLVLSRRKQPSQSRSGTAVQSKGKIRAGRFNNTKYLSAILQKLTNSLKNLNAISI